MADLESRLETVLGGRTAKAMAKVLDGLGTGGVPTVGDLLRHYPRRMAERGELTDLGSLRLDEDVTVVAEVLRTRVLGYRNNVRLEVVVGDDRGTLNLVFFGRRSMWRERELQPGVRALFAGKVGQFNRTRQLTHPDYQLLSGDELDGFEADMFASRLIPVYPATATVASWTIAKAINHCFSLLDPLVDPLPAEIRARHGLVDFDSAIHGIHQPPDRDGWYASRRRLKWDEAFGVQLVLARRRAAASANPAVPRPPHAGGILAAFDDRLPFQLTGGQQEIGTVLAAELTQPHPMHRLLQGEVGSGKTVVALRAMLQVVDAGGQAALLAPTEVLAAQHARTIEAMLGPLAQAGRLGGAELGTRVALLTGSLPAAARKAALLDAASGAAGIVVGTHALIQAQVGFAELGLVVVDEQHRFGVEQRDALRSKAAQPPHLLVMTATPIPRTVAMTVFGDLDTSILAELPAGRSPIATTVVPTGEKPAWLERVWARIREEVAAGRQAYIVCPRIGTDAGATGAEGAAAADDSPVADVDPIDGDPIDGGADDGGADDGGADDGGADDGGADDGGADDDQTSARRPPLALTDVFAMLADGPLHGVRLAALHGRLSPDEKDHVMAQFSAGQIDVLVATTVIEVGVDVPNATVMAVLDADRFGVSQLHQLRGRVGRGAAPGLCLLVSDVPAAAPARERLDAVAATTDGFELARLDVEQRREGDVLGVAQSGRRSQFRLLSLLHDEELIVAAREEASALVDADPELAGHPLLAMDVAVLAADERTEYLDKA